MWTVQRQLFVTVGARNLLLQSLCLAAAFVGEEVTLRVLSRLCTWDRDKRSGYWLQLPLFAGEERERGRRVYTAESPVQEEEEEVGAATVEALRSLASASGAQAS